jgi:N-acetylneuraminic acid mutarotase
MFRARKEISLFVILMLVLSVVPGCSAQVANSEQRPETGVSFEGSVVAISSMASKRAAHTATLLNNGKVLIAGGFVAGGRSLASAELFDPVANTFEPAGDMTTARNSHTASLLPDGKVLIVGGYSDDYLSTTEIYDPETNRFSASRPLSSPRSGHVAVTLSDGRILFAGGVGTGWTFLKTAEIYQPKTDTFAPTGDMTTERESHTATMLNDGKVLITGGHKDRRANVTIYRSSEIFDPTRGRFTATGDLTVKRHKHEATKLPDGRVLIIGGSDERDGDGAYQNAEIYDVAKGTFTSIANRMVTARYKLQGTAIVLRNGKVLIAGGSDRAEVFDPATNSFSLADGELGTMRLFATATLLKNGRVLITGGYHDGRSISDGAWIYSA